MVVSIDPESVKVTDCGFRPDTALYEAAQNLG